MQNYSTIARLIKDESRAGNTDHSLEDLMAQPEILDMNLPVNYKITYEDQQNYIKIIRYKTGELSIQGGSPTLLNRLGGLFDFRKPFRVL